MKINWAKVKDQVSLLDDEAGGGPDPSAPWLLVVDDEEAVSALISHWAFVPHVTPVQIFNRATDPFLPLVKQHMLHTLELLDGHGFGNHVLVITRWKVTPEDAERLEATGI